MRVATYNVHGCVGTDGRTDPDRVVDVIRELSAEVLALQEVAGDAGEGAQWRTFAQATGLHGAFGPTHDLPGGPFGNALLTVAPTEDPRVVDLSVPGREPRGALVARVVLGGQRWTAVATHFGLGLSERAEQAERLVDALPPGGPLLLLADVNAFVPWSPALRRLRRRFGPPVAPASFPSRWPLLPLDRIWPGRGVRVLRGWAHRSPSSRRASDHLPVCADIASAAAGEAP